MNYYKIYTITAVCVLIVLSGFIGMLFFWPEPKSTDAAVQPQKADAKQILNNDSYLSMANLAGIDDISNEVVLENNDKQQLYTDNELSENSFVEIDTSDSGSQVVYTPLIDADIKYNVVANQSGIGTSSSRVSSTRNSDSFGSGISSAGGSGSGTSNSGVSGTGRTSNSGAFGSNASSSSTDVIPSDIVNRSRRISSIFIYSEDLKSGRQKLPLSTAMDNLLKYDAFWSAQGIASMYPDAWRTLRTEYPDRLALFYIVPILVRPDTTLVSYLDYQYINQNHPEWFLLKDEKNVETGDYRDPAKRMRWINDPKSWYYNCFLLDVGNPQFQDWAIEQFVGKLDQVSGITVRIRYSGIGMDMVTLTTFQNGRTKTSPDWKYASGGWNQAYFSYIKKLHDALQRKDYVLVVNQTLDYSSQRDDSDWQSLMAIVDGMMDEEAMMSGKNLFGGEMWGCSMRHHEDIIKKGLYDWWECNFHDYKNQSLEYRNFLYVYCSFLLVMNNNCSLFGVHRRENGNNLDPWYEEYNLPLGSPVGLRYQQQDCWLRDYQYGRIVVNPSSNRCTISLDSDTYTLDWRTKKTITRLVLEPLSATILLPTGYRVN